MNGAQSNYETHDQELLAIVESFKHWRHYLEGAQHEILVLTDHHNLKKFMETTRLSPRQVRWAQELSRYNFQIDYRQGKKNPADALSRRPDLMHEDETTREENSRILQRLQKSLRLSANGGPAIGAMLTSNSREESLENTTPRDQLESTAPTKHDRLGHIDQLQHETVPMTEAVAPTVQQLENADWITLAAGGAFVAGRIDEIAALRTAVESEQAYDEVPGEPLVRMIPKFLQEDPFAVAVRRSLATSAEGNEAWSDDENGLLRHEGKIYLPERLRTDVLARYHDDPLAGHFGTEKTLHLLQRKYYWPNPGSDPDAPAGMREFVRIYCDSCAVCRRSKSPRHKPYGELQSLPIPEFKWSDLTMDFVTGLPNSSDWTGASFDSILVVVDRLTKMVHYIPVTKTITAKAPAEVLIREIVRYHGLPNSMVTDRGSLFTSSFYSSLCYALKIKRKLSTAFHPQTDGQTERQNSTMEQYLRAYVNFTQDNWVSLLPMAEFSYNNAYNSSIKTSPFIANIGYSPRMSWEEDPDPKSRAKAALDDVQELRQLTAVLREALATAQRDQARFKDRRTKSRSYRIGEKVYLNGKNIRTKRNNKLEWKMFGPFEIIDAKPGNRAYQLALPAHWKIHDVFHVSLLERASPRKGGEAIELTTIPPDDIDIEADDPEYVVNELADSAVFETGEVPNSPDSHGGLYYLVDWKGYEEFDRTWEPYEGISHLRRLIREFHRDCPDKPDGRTLTPAKRPARSATQRPQRQIAKQPVRESVVSQRPQRRHNLRKRKR